MYVIYKNIYQPLRENSRNRLLKMIYYDITFAGREIFVYNLTDQLPSLEVLII